MSPGDDAGILPRNIVNLKIANEEVKKIKSPGPQCLTKLRKENL
jgi:hypothetical protein